MYTVLLQIYYYTFTDKIRFKKKKNKRLCQESFEFIAFDSSYYENEGIFMSFL